jgi:single-strand DNA-binding protein
MNKVQLVGRIGSEVELRYMPNGDAVLNITLATEKSWIDRLSNEKKAKTEWHRIVAFKHTAKLIAEYYKKGDILFAEGELSTRKWTNTQGQEQYTSEVTLHQLDFSKNTVLVVGHIGIDLIPKALPSGGTVLNFTIATKQTWKNKQTQQKEEKTEWHSVVAFNKQAEIIAQYFSKGAKIIIEGELQTKKWTPQNGLDQYKTEIKLSQFHFAEKKKQPVQQPSQQPSQQGGIASQNNDFQKSQAPDFQHSGFDDFDDEQPL